MKAVHYAEIRVFIKEGDSLKIIEQGFKNLIPLDFEREKIMIEKEITEGFDEKKIIIERIQLKKESHLNVLIKTITRRLSKADKLKILIESNSRLDDIQNFYLRFNKVKMSNNILEITDLGNCYHLTLSIAAYPKNKYAALKVINRIFENDNLKEL